MLTGKWKKVDPKRVKSKRGVYMGLHSLGFTFI